MDKQSVINEILESGAKFVTTSISRESCSVEIAIQDIECADFLPDDFQWEEKATGLSSDDY